MSVPADADEALRVQDRLAPQVVRVPPPDFAPRTAAGLDVAYAADSNLVAAAVVIVDIESGTKTEAATAVGKTDFPYAAGLFAFRELPTLLDAFGRLTEKPDLLVADGHGIAHPRRFGLASHLGVVTGLPTIGVAKTPLCHYDPPGPNRGETSPLVDAGEEVGAALRTQPGVKPVFVSIGHRIDLASACEYILRLARGFRLPETTRLADQLCRKTLRELCLADGADSRSLERGNDPPTPSSSTRG